MSALINIRSHTRQGKVVKSHFRKPLALKKKSSTKRKLVVGAGVVGAGALGAGGAHVFGKVKRVKNVLTDRYKMGSGDAWKGAVKKAFSFGKKAPKVPALKQLA